MIFADWLQRHRRSLLFLAAALAVAGVVSAFRLPVSLLPNVQFPRIVVELDAGDRPASQTELALTRPVELAVRDIPGVQSVRSTTSRGSAEIFVNFGWGRNMLQALLAVESRISVLLPHLPANTTFTVHRRDPTVFPVIAYSLVSKTQDPVALRDLAQYQLVPLLSRVQGVSRVAVQGGRTAEFHIDVDAAKLRAFHLSLADVTDAVSAGNVLTAVGKLEDHYKLYLLVADARLQTKAGIRNVVIKRERGDLITVGDVAGVTLGTVPQWIRVTANGRDAVLLNIYQQPGANTVEIDRGVARALAAYRDKLPADVAISKWYDQSSLIVASAGSVRDAILIGVALAALMLFVFLHDLRITAIAFLVVPAAIAIAVFALYLLGLGFNIMTLGGIAAAVGLVIDDVVVMSEHIVRRVREGKLDTTKGRIFAAAREFTRPLAGSSTSTIIIFVPLAFLGGLTGAFFKSLALTMGSALVISFLLAWLAVPVLARWLVRGPAQGSEDAGSIARRIYRCYRRLMGGLLNRPVWLLAGIVPLVVLGYLGYRYVGSGFLPHMDEGGFVLDYLAAPGTSLSETDRMLRQIGDILRHDSAVASYSRRTGNQLGGGLTEANTGDFFIRLKDFPRPPIGEVMNRIRKAVNRRVPGLEIDLSQLMEDMIGDLTAVPQPVEIKLYSSNTDELLQLAPRVAEAVGKVPGIVDVFDGVRYAGDAVRIHVDESRAAAAGLTVADISSQLDTYLQGTVAAKVQQGLKFVGIRVWTPPGGRLRTDQLTEVPVRASNGATYPLGDLAAIHIVTGEPEIDRDNLKRMFAVTARISGRDLGSTIRDVKTVLARPGLIPANVDVELGGLYRQQQIAFRGLAAVFTGAVAFVFVLLLYMYERFRIVLAILTAPLLAVGTVFLGLWVTGTELNITAIMGLTMIVGIVTEVAIFYFSEFEQLDAAGGFKAALIDAGVNRMRAIGLTTCTTTLALMPLALDVGRGAAMQQPLAIAIITGMVVQMPLVLIVMPTVYYLLARGRFREA